MTMNSTWGHCPSDTTYKSARELVHTLCEVAGRGGNLLLNVSPRGDGSLPDEQVERLDAVATWMAAHREAILDTEPGLEPWQFYGPSTRAGDRIYLHLLARPYDSVTVRGLPVRRIAGVRHVATGTDLTSRTRCSVLDEMFNFDPLGDVVIDVPDALIDPLATVIAVDLAPPGSTTSTPLAFRS